MERSPGPGSHLVAMPSLPEKQGGKAVAATPVPRPLPVSPRVLGVCERGPVRVHGRCLP